MIPIHNPHDAELALPADDSLIPAIIQDADSLRVLMLGYMNHEALRRTRETGRATFFSRSRGKLWEKGETSGNTLHVDSMAIDCDGDALLVQARPSGPVCHTGTDTCWGAVDTDDAGSEDFQPSERRFLRKLERIVDSRIESDSEESYTVRLMRGGAKKMAQKVGEEGLEVALESVAGNDDRLIQESADLLYHLIVLLRSRQKSLGDVEAVLRGRHAGG